VLDNDALRRLAALALAVTCALLVQVGPAQASRSGHVHRGGSRHHARDHRRHRTHRHKTHRHKTHHHKGHPRKGARGGSGGEGEAGPLQLGVYDCMAYDVVTGMVEYKESVKLIAGGIYEQAWDRNHTTFIKPTKGSWKIEGSLIVFHGGALADTPGEIVSEPEQTPFFALLREGEPSGWSCYHVSD